MADFKSSSGWVALLRCASNLTYADLDVHVRRLFFFGDMMQVVWNMLDVYRWP